MRQKELVKELHQSSRARSRYRLYAPRACGGELDNSRRLCSRCTRLPSTSAAAPRMGRISRATAPAMARLPRPVVARAAVAVRRGVGMSRAAESLLRVVMAARTTPRAASRWVATARVAVTMLVAPVARQAGAPGAQAAALAPHLLPVAPSLAEQAPAASGPVKRSTGEGPVAPAPPAKPRPAVERDAKSSVWKR